MSRIEWEHVQKVLDEDLATVDTDLFVRTKDLIGISDQTMDIILFGAADAGIYHLMEDGAELNEAFSQVIHTAMRVGWLLRNFELEADVKAARVPETAEA